MNQGNDRDYIKKIKEGKLDYFAFIIDKYAKKIYNYFYQRLADKEESEDLTQETFLSFYKNLENFDEEKAILPYLLSIASNHLKMFYRKTKKPLPLAKDLRAEDDYQKIENEILIENLPLSEKEKQIVKLIAAGYRYFEIAKMLKLKENTLKSIIRRLRLKVNQQNEQKKAKV